MLTRLRRAAVDGAVPESVFVEHVRALGLGDVERERLREELAGLGLPVLRAVAHADGDGSNAEKVARIREEIVSTPVFSSDDVVRTLLERYADAEGYVASRALDGVARLAGLGARDAAALRAGARIRGEVLATAEAVAATGEDERQAAVSEQDRGPVGPAVPVVEAAAPVAGDDLTDLTDQTDAEAPQMEDGPEGEPFPPSDTEPGGDLGDLTAAVAAALAVLENDRFRRRPDMSLLSAEAEVGLAVLIRGGPDRLAEEPDDEALRGLPHEDLRIRARDCLVLHNQRLVHKMAPRYLEQGLDYDDLFQHGVLGLMRAARKFDPSKGFKFSTYATWWIRQSISRAIADEGAVIRIPVHMHEQVRKVALAERTLAIQGRPAGVADVAVYCDMTMQKVEEARKLSRRTDSLDRVIGDGVTLGDFIGQANPLPPVDKAVLDAMLLEQVTHVVDTFSGREARILVRRLGLDGDETLTLDELGREFGVTRERIRQIEVKILPVFRQRLREAGLTAAYGHDGGSAPEAGEPVKRQASDRGAGRAGTHRKHSEEKRTPDALSPDMPRDASRDVPSRSAGTVETSVAEAAEAAGWLGAETAVAGPADRTTTDSMLSAVLMAEQEEPQVQVEGPSEERPDAPQPPADQGVGAVAADAIESGNELVPRPRVAAPEPLPRHSPSAPASTEASGLPATEPAAPARYTADWRQALRMPTEFGGGVAWLAEYALLAVGHVQLTVLLGASPADAVVRAVRERGVLDRPVVKALEVLRLVFDTVKEAGLTPEDFLERGSAELSGASPRNYLAERPLVHGEPRLAVRAALREFVTELSSRAVPEAVPVGAAPGGLMAQPHADPDRGPASGGEAHGEDPAPSPDHLDADALSVPRELTDARVGVPQPTPVAPAAEGGQMPTRADTVRQLVQLQTRADRQLAQALAEAEEQRARLRAEADRHLADARREHEAELTRAQDEHRRRLAEERSAGDARLAAAQADSERRLDALEEELLRRTDRALLRKEQHLRAQAEERIARLEGRHRDARLSLVERAEHAEQRERAARTALAAAGERAARSEQRAKDADHVARTAEQRAHDAEHRANTAEERAAVLYQRANEAQRRAEATGQRLRRYTEEGETRVAGLEQRLRQAEALLAERDAALRAAQQQASAQAAAAEQRATARIAQTEQEAWDRINELQRQLAAEGEAAADRSTLRNRWRRS
ncbi:sigma-70 family RNA polymerase sigma factor [Streptomyces hilarionis]|uniref:sigma-70 family RNA polymerase sigma factor n=1 Tax=Streptomyces hilarionis TaxID=2839954 RepID=UPI00211A1005|nr:sigma-70 family RNA polymerase sigma factor [Streptomyces hilarionis]MCQ9134737.1 sigma-70 family RNA polymerase sigma factor [Streptomyces hilarionis]